MISEKNGRLYCCTCGKGSVKDTREYATFLCDCGIIIYYYSSRISMFVDKKTYLRNKDNGDVR